jgi:hypothetical protein
MPTAAITNSDSDSSLISKQGTAELSTLTQAARGPVYGGHLKGTHQPRSETLRAHTIVLYPDGMLSIESEVGGLTLSGNLWNGFEVKRLQNQSLQTEVRDLPRRR